MTIQTTRTPDRATVKIAGMIVRDLNDRVGVIIGVRYTGETRLCHVLYKDGHPATQWWPGVDLIPATENAAKAAGFKRTTSMRGKAERYDW